METRILKLDPDRFDPPRLDEAARILREGGLVAFPTETVYGIGVNLDRPESVRRLLELRRSPDDKHLTVHVASREDAARFAGSPVPVGAQRLMRRFWPGPLTIVLPAHRSGSKGGTVGLRYPDHRIAVELIRRAGVKVGAPSANLSAQPPATDAEAVRRDFDGKIEFIVDGGASRHGVSSTVVKVEGRRATVLREGAVAAALVEETNAPVVLFVCSGNTCRSPMAERLLRSMLDRAPGGLRIRVVSAGTAAGHGAAASVEAEIAVKELDADLAGHRSRPLSISMSEDADRIYVMTRSQKDVIEEWMPELAGRVALLDPGGGEIEDPVGGTLETYRATAKRIRECIEKRMGEVLELGRGG
ncbi:MAG: threonylcarbamoyl-AMP synthase [Planctomycetes bacterium]|nr:threonylcarbamoyl-AMP synthase [Planctomycetota bacterium]